MDEYSVGGDVVSALSSLAPLAPGWSRLLLCRHGETASNKTKLLQGGGADTPLNELGRKQAGQLADALAASGVVVDRIATSHLLRAIVTANPIASHFPAAQRVVHRGLGEMLYGEIEGKPIAEMGKQMGQIAQSWREGDTSVRVGGPEGESPEVLLERAQAALADVSAELPVGGTLLVVAHSHVNKALLAALSGRGLSRIHSMPQDNGGLNVCLAPPPRAHPARLLFCPSSCCPYQRLLLLTLSLQPPPSLLMLCAPLGGGR
jgi:broad specificity phosphatase PhoE